MPKEHAPNGRAEVVRIPLRQFIETATTVGERLGVARSLAGLTMGQAARLMLITVPHLCDIEHGRIPASPVMVAKMCDYYGAHVHWVTTGERHEMPRLRGMERLADMDADDLRALLSVIA